MKKSTIAVAALLTVLSTVPVMSVAYADESAPASDNAAPASDNATQGTDSSGSTDGGSSSGDDKGDTDNNE